MTAGRFAAALRRATTAALVLGLAAGAAGQVVRDRWLATGLLLYVPLLPAGVGAILYDLARRGRTWPRPRFALTGAGLAATATAAALGVGRGPDRPPAAPADEVRVVHWNVRWGGVGRPGEDAWGTLIDAILDHRPDLIVLSEAPGTGSLERLRTRAGAGWELARRSHPPGRRDWYSLAVLSRWPVRPGPLHPIADGVAWRIDLETPGRTLRLLVVDAVSDPLRWRLPRLRDVAALLGASRAAGEPIDLIAGDFNTPGRSVGFDPIAASYTLAASRSTGWRGTWQAPLPLYDIDHVAVRADWPIVGCRLFGHRATDHRGQVVRLAIPDDLTASGTTRRTAPALRGMGSSARSPARRGRG